MTIRIVLTVLSATIGIFSLLLLAAVWIAETGDFSGWNFKPLFIGVVIGVTAFGEALGTLACTSWRPLDRSKLGLVGKIPCFIAIVLWLITLYLDVLQG